jgi:stage V sporulation protein B
MMISFPAAVGLAVLADPIIAMLFPLHPEGGWLLRYGAASIVLLGIVHVITGVLQGAGYVKIPVIGVVIGVFVKLPLNWHLISIPEINILGAVISTIACFAVAACVNLFFLRHFLGIFPDLKSTFYKPLLASAGMGFVCYSVYHLMYIFTSNLVATLVTLVFAVFTYLIFMVLIRGFSERDLQALPIPARMRKWLIY